MKNLLLPYDTETTGFPIWQERSTDERQPHLVQLATKLVCEDYRKTLQGINVIIRPEGWVIPEEVSRVHGITQEMAEDVGISEKVAVEMFIELWKKSHCRIAHNDQFDARIMRIAIYRAFSEDVANDISEKWKAASSYCTANNSTAIVQCPPSAKMIAANRRHFKKPNLSEAYKHFTGKELVGAHNAMVDVNACMEVFWGIRDHTSKQTLKQPEVEAVINI